MARQRGVIKLEGTLDDVTFYKSLDGYIAKTKSSISRSRILTDPQFVRTRENMQEFTLAAHSGKDLRDIANVLIHEAPDTRVVSRVLRLMSLIAKFDTTSPRGERNVGVAIANPAALALLRGFEFNSKSQIASVLLNPYTVNTSTGVIAIGGLIPINDVTAPPSATHLTLRGAFAVVNFATAASEIKYTNEVNLPIDSTATNVLLTPTAVPTLAGTKIFLLQIEFFQEINAVQYELNNGIFNALVIAEVA
jgi:hypothetical protein